MFNIESQPDYRKHRKHEPGTQQATQPCPPLLVGAKHPLRVLIYLFRLQEGIPIDSSYWLGLVGPD